MGAIKLRTDDRCNTNNGEIRLNKEYGNADVYLVQSEGLS